MPKILCIDDTPDEKLASGLSLKETAKNIFKDTSYEVIFKKSGNEGVKTASGDMEIKLVLLDVEFNKRVEGPQIADELQKKAPLVKVIVLTRVDDKGNKISFGWKPNVVHYVLKRDISMSNLQIKLKSLCEAIIEDYTNKNWGVKYNDGSDAIILTNTKTEQCYGIDIPLTSKPALLKCMQEPNCPVDLPTEEFGKNLNKVHNSINEKVLEGTEWNTWGILTREGCAKGQLKLVIGSVAGASVPESQKDTYILKSEFEEFKKEIESRLAKIEQTLNFKRLKKK